MTDDELKKLAYSAASILKAYNIINEKQFKGMTVNSFNKYTKKYFLGSIKIRCAIVGISEEKWLECNYKLADPKFNPLFKPGENDFDGTFGSKIVEVSDESDGDEVSGSAGDDEDGIVGESSSDN